MQFTNQAITYQWNAGKMHFKGMNKYLYYIAILTYILKGWLYYKRMDSS